MEGFIIFLSIMLLVAIVAVRRRLKQKSSNKDEGRPTSDPGRFLHGHDLNKWHYLGYIILKLDDSEHPTFLFCDKNDFTRRSYTIIGVNRDYVKKNHGYVSKYLDPWKVGEGNIYDYARDGQSTWLKDYMLKKYAVTWDNTKRWWVGTNESTYNHAKGKQKADKTARTTESSSDSNVITVDFGGN